MKFTMQLPDGSIYSGELTKQQTQVQEYRKPHDVEIRSYDDKRWEYMGDGYRGGRVRGAVLDAPLQRPMPEVYRTPFPDQQTPIPCKWMHVWKDLNPQLSVSKFSTLLD